MAEKVDSIKLIFFLSQNQRSTDKSYVFSFFNQYHLLILPLVYLKFYITVFVSLRKLLVDRKRDRFYSAKPQRFVFYFTFRI